jgi:UDP-N-acetylmuramoyl-tripeptide--D-alanyl-D-alanine ligase
MPTFSQDILAAWTGGTWSGTPDAPVTGFTADSRRLSPGHCFVALKTARRDGHDFLGEALKAGACAALVSKADPAVAIAQLVVADPLSALQAVAREHRKTFGGPVIGITGSAGKTSTKELLSLALGAETGDVLATEGNLNNHIGVALTLCRLDPATHRFAVVEAGISAPGEMKVLAGMIDPDMVLVTLIGPAHLEELGGLDGVAREKAVLARAVRRGGTCILPSSCANFFAFRDLPGSSRIFMEEAGDAGSRAPWNGRVAYSVSHDGDRTSVTVDVGDRPIGVTLRRTTDGMARNAAMAVFGAYRLGTAIEDIQRRLVSWRPAQLRGEWTSSEGRRVYLDCYNANPASMADALATFDAVAPADEPRLLVLGCMEELGAESERYHLELGRSLRLRRGDHLVAIGSLASAIRQGALEGGNEDSQIEIADTVAPLAARLSAFRGSVFVKGSRRHELEKAFTGAEHAGVAHA